ncbi:MAG TPA: hypothetical protein VIE67_01945 [Rudaea sp.]|uniref:hypothetical protein n=1 Tax=Rudaea sp. TaxID=2136325 RepID=UPI002F942A13
MAFTNFACGPVQRGEIPYPCCARSGNERIDLLHDQRRLLIAEFFLGALRHAAQQILVVQGWLALVVLAVVAGIRGAGPAAVIAIDLRPDHRIERAILGEFKLGHLGHRKHATVRRRRAQITLCLIGIARDRRLRIVAAPVDRTHHVLRVGIACQSALAPGGENLLALLLRRGFVEKTCKFGQLVLIHPGDTPRRAEQHKQYANDALEIHRPSSCLPQ